jgi:hypothetical protein
MSEKHTQGPWWASEGYSFVLMVKAPSRSGASVAHVLPHVEIPDEEAKANYHLIAAAPELLEALEELLSREWQDDDGAPTLEVARSNARAAIAKARGE